MKYHGSCRSRPLQLWLPYQTNCKIQFRRCRCRSCQERASSWNPSSVKRITMVKPSPPITTAPSIVFVQLSIRFLVAFALCGEFRVAAGKNWMKEGTCGNNMSTDEASGLNFTSNHSLHIHHRYRKLPFLLVATTTADGSVCSGASPPLKQQYVSFRCLLLFFFTFYVIITQRLKLLVFLQFYR